MLFVYDKSNGEIDQASIPETTLEEYYGAKTEEMSQVFDALYIEAFNPLVFLKFYKYKVNLTTKELNLK